MIRGLYVAAALLFARGALAATCTFDGKPTVPAILEPVATSFCHDVLQTKTAALKTVPTALTAFLSPGSKLSSFCSCVLDHPTRTTRATPPQSHLATGSGATVTVTTCVLQSTITLSASTVTIPASTVTIPASTVTLSASTITLFAPTVTVTTTATLASCTPAAKPPAGALCGSNAIYSGISIFLLSGTPNTAPSLGACMEQCQANSACQSISFDGTNCALYSQTVTELELGGIIFPVNAGVAGSSPFYDVGCLVCPSIKRRVARAEGDEGDRGRDAGVARREARLERRVLAGADRERRRAGLS